MFLIGTKYRITKSKSFHKNTVRCNRDVELLFVYFEKASDAVKLDSIQEFKYQNAQDVIVGNYKTEMAMEWTFGWTNNARWAKKL